MDTWWIDNPHLLGTRNPTIAILEQLRRDGFTVIVSLLKEDEQAPQYNLEQVAALGFARHNIPVQDFQPPTLDQLDQFVRLIASLSPGTKVIVHCEGGSGRTGTFAAAYWVAKGMPVSDAIAKVRKARPCAVETPEQEDAVGRFADRCMDSA